MSNTVTRRHTILIAKARKRMRRGLLSVTSVLATLAVVAAGLVAGTMAATAAPVPSTTPDLTGYAGPRMVQLSEGGSQHQLGLDEDGAVWAWGANNYRQVLGNSTVATPTPVEVTAVAALLATSERVVQVAGSDDASFAVTSEGRLISWGSNSNGELGRGNTAVSATPGFVLSAAGTELQGITKVAGGGTYALALDNSGHVWSWGVASRNRGQLGHGNTLSKLYATQIADTVLSGVTDIDAGYWNAGAVANGKVYAWGTNNADARILGVDSSAFYLLSPLPVLTTSGMTGTIVDLSVGHHYASFYARDDQGQVWSWGIQASGLLGRDGVANLPGRVLDVDGNALTGTTALASGDQTGFAVAADSTVYAWGLNTSGQLGINQNGGSTNRATKVKNFDLDAATYGAELSGVESIGAGYHHLSVISKVGNVEGVVSTAGNSIVTGQSPARNVQVPNLVWKFEHTLKDLPLTLVPRNGETYKTHAAPNPANLVQRTAGTFNYGTPAFELTEVTAESTTNYGVPVTYAMSGNCSINPTTEVVTANYAGYCNITRSFTGSALVKPISSDYWQVMIGKQLQNIAALGTTATPGAILTGLTTDSSPVVLPISTDAPANQASLTYTVTAGNPAVCKLSAYDGVTTNAQRYLQPLGEGTCEITVTQSGNASQFEPMTKVISFVIGAGAQPQSLDMSGLNGIRYHATNQTHSLPPTTTVGGEAVTYVSSTPLVCTVSGATLTATGAGNCVLSVTAPAGTGGTNGYLAYADTKTVVIGKGIQTLSMPGIYNSLTVATSSSGVLPTTTTQGIALTNWLAVKAPTETKTDVCSISGGAVLAGADAPVLVTDAPVDCLVTVSNVGDANYEPFTYSEVVTIDPRDMQTVDLSVLDGKKFGDAPFNLPATTVQGQPLTYTASGSCQVVGNQVTILSGGDCVITASAEGTNGALPAYRPFLFTKTAPISAIGQFVNGMPALNALKVGSISGSLPVQTAQGKVVTWASGTPAICELVTEGGVQRVRILADGDCTITGSAPGDASYTPFAYALTFVADINYDALNAEIAAKIVSNLDGNGDPHYTADTWAAYQSALAAAVAAQSPNGVSQANVDQLTTDLVAAKVALVDLTPLRNAYADRVTSSAPYTPASWAVYVQKVADALDILNNDAGATAAEVTAAADALRAATNDLLLLADFTALQAEANIAGGLVESDYIAGGWADYQLALSAAQAVLGNQNATQAEVDAAEADLEAARLALVDISDLTELVGFENDADRQQGDFTPATWPAYADALADAEAVLADPNATQAEVDAALAALQSASSALVWTQQLNPTLLDTITGHAIGDAPVLLPTVTDRGAAITYEVDADSSEICQIIDGRLYFIGFGDCMINWSAPAIGNFPASTGSEEAPTAPGIQLIADGSQVLEGAELAAGQSLTARGGGLEPGSTLTVELRPGQGVLGTAVVGADGTAIVKFTIPEGIRPGAYTVHASGVSSVDGSTLTRSANVAVQNLAFTGAEVLPVAAGALLLLLAGLGAMLVARRRKGLVPAE